MVGFIFIGHLVDWFSLDVEFILSIAAAGSEVGTLGQRSVCGSLLAVEFFFLRFFFYLIDWRFCLLRFHQPVS